MGRDAAAGKGVCCHSARAEVPDGRHGTAGSGRNRQGGERAAPFLCFILFGFVVGCGHLLERDERQGGTESKKSPMGVATVYVGTHAHTLGAFFKSLALGLKPVSMLCGTLALALTTTPPVGHADNS